MAQDTTRQELIWIKTMSCGHAYVSLSTACIIAILCFWSIFEPVALPLAHLCETGQGLSQKSKQGPLISLSLSLPLLLSSSHSKVNEGKREGEGAREGEGDEGNGREKGTRREREPQGGRSRFHIYGIVVPRSLACKQHRAGKPVSKSTQSIIMIP
jgi:hypothetical protein